MDHMTFLQQPELHRPVLVAAFEGWNDAGEAASTALGFVGSALGAEPFARIDPEDFYDFQQVRPVVRLEGGGRRVIDWPLVELAAARPGGSEHDLVLLRGPEPNLRWRTFVREILDVAERLGVEMVVTLGALLADVPHTRPVQVMGVAADPDLAERLGLATSRYEGPTGIIGVLNDFASAAQVPAISLWATLPHYVQASPNPRAALALVQKLRDLLALPVDTRSLEEATRAFDDTVAGLVAEDPELAEYVERLEGEADQPSLADVSPEQLVADLERYLRDQPGGKGS